MLRLHFPNGDLIIDHRSALAPVRGLQCLDSEDEVRRLLLLALTDPAALDRLRRFWAQWHSESWRVAVINDRRLIERVARMCVNGPLAAFAVYAKPSLNTSHVAEKLAVGALRRRQPTIGAPQPVSVANRSVGAPKPVHLASLNIGAPKPVFPASPGAAAPPSAPPSDTLSPSDIAMMSTELRFEQVLRRTPPYLPQAIRGDFMKLLDPTSLVLTVGVLAIWAGSHAFGIGFIVDALLLIVGMISLGMAIFDVAESLRKALDLTLQAKREEDLNEAAKLLADVVSKIGVAAFVALITHGARRAASSAMKGKAPERPRPEPVRARIEQRGTPPPATKPSPPAEDDSRPATGFLGRAGFELKNVSSQPVRNKPASINGRQYSGHALDQMQNRGIMPSVVDNTLRTGNKFTTRPGTTGVYDPVNNIRVIINSETGVVVTVIRGAPK